MAGRDLLRLKSMLRIAASRRYASLPIPSDEDVLVEEFIREWRNGGAATPEAAGALDGVAGFLGAFVERAASRAVRGHGVESVRLGLWALCIGGEGEDPRDLQQHACVLFDSCDRIGVEPAFLFKEALAEARGGAAQILRAFADMSRADFDLAKYRVRADSDADGFRYRLGLAGAA